MNTLYTYGYEGTDPDILSEWADQGVVIADIRYGANSRNPIWTKARLSARLQGQYVHLKELGNENYKGQLGAGHMISELENGLKKLAALLMKSPVLLICVCANHKRCHRSTVCTALLNQYPDTTIIHLRKNKRPEDPRAASDTIKISFRRKLIN